VGEDHVGLRSPEPIHPPESSNVEPGSNLDVTGRDAVSTQVVEVAASAAECDDERFEPAFPQARYEQGKLALCPADSQCRVQEEDAAWRQAVDRLRI
jgi:hypothetical protein